MFSGKSPKRPVGFVPGSNNDIKMQRYRFRAFCHVYVDPVRCAVRLFKKLIFQSFKLLLMPDAVIVNKANRKWLGVHRLRHIDWAVI